VSQSPLPGPEVTGKDDPVERALGDVPRPNPPAGLAESIMKRVAAVEAGFSAWRRWRRSAKARRITNFLPGQRVGSDQTKREASSGWTDGHLEARGGVIVRAKILWGVTGVAAAAIVSIFVFGYPPIGNSGTEGSIGQAQRYQGATLSAKDISVPDTDVQQFIQSETFDRLLKDREAREALLAMFRNQELAMALALPQVRTLAADRAALEAFGRPSVQSLFANNDAREALAAPTVAALLPSMRPHLENAAFVEAFALPGIEQAFAAPAIQTALIQGNLEVLMAQPSLAAFVSRPGVANVLQDANARLALSNPMFVRLLAMPAMQNALADQAAMKILVSPNLAAVMADARVSMALAKPSVVSALGQPAIQTGLANAALMSALNVSAFERALAVPGNHGAIAAGLGIKQ
jgi:hypothetical protein